VIDRLKQKIFENPQSLQFARKDVNYNYSSFFYCGTVTMISLL